MKLINKIDIYKYDLSDEPVELRADLTVNGEIVEIIFDNGEFREVRYRFESPYTEGEWELLALINEKIKELKKTYFSPEDKD